MVSRHLFHLVHCHQPLHTCPPGGPHAFYVTFLDYLGHFAYEGQSRSLSTSLTAQFSIINLCPLLSSLIRLTCPNQLSTFFILTVTSSLVSVILCISSLQMRSAKLTPYILRIDRISTAFIFTSFFFCNIHVSFPYNSVGIKISMCSLWISLAFLSLIF